MFERIIREFFSRFSLSGVIALVLALVMLAGAMAFLLMKVEALFIVLLIVVGVGLGAYWFLSRKQQRSAANRVMPWEAAVAKNDCAVHYAILKEIREVAELIVFRENFHEVVNYSDCSKTTLPFFNQEVSIPGTTKNLLIEYRATITCGCKNLDAIKIERSTLPGGNGIQMIVPYSQVLDCYVEPSSVKVHNKSEQIFASDIDLETQNQILSEHLQGIVKKETENGLLERSNESIKTRLLNIAQKNGTPAEIAFTKDVLSPGSYIDTSDLPRIRQ